MRIPLSELVAPQVGTIIKLENHNERLAGEPTRNSENIEKLQREIADLETKLNDTDPWGEKLNDARMQLRAIQREIQEIENGQAPIDGLSNAQAANLPQKSPKNAQTGQTEAEEDFLDWDPEEIKRRLEGPSRMAAQLQDDFGFQALATQDHIRGHSFFPQESRRESIPRLGENRQGATEDAVVHLHYFTSSTHWYVTEVNWDSGQAYGAVSANGHTTWESIDLVSLEAQRNRPEGSSRFLPPVIVSRDTHWKPIPWKNAQRVEAPAPGSVVHPPTATVHAEQSPTNHLPPTNSVKEGRKISR